MTITISLDEAERGGPCQPGIDAWLAVLERGPSYTVPEIMLAGFPAEYAEWLLIDLARRDSDALLRLRAWVAACGGEPKATAEQCVQEAARVRVIRYRARMVVAGMTRAEAKAEAAAEDFAKLVETFS